MGRKRSRGPLSGVKDLASTFWGNCQLGCTLLLVPWILTALVIELFPGPSYGLVQAFTCPANTSIRVQGTQGWFVALIGDDESVEFPRYTCVNSQGTVVRSGDSLAAINAYMYVFAAVLLGILAIVVTVPVARSIRARLREDRGFTDRAP